ncbi:MAG: type IV secretory system conjugative DNA transfer family protein [Alphaproteobacteria bacterium]
MILQRVILILIFISFVVLTLVQWNAVVGFNAFGSQWWVWLVNTLLTMGGLPNALIYPVWWTGAGALMAMAATMLLFNRPGSRTLHGGTDARDTHGSARWASWRDVRTSGLSGSKGAVVGGFKRTFRTQVLHHDGPEHILCFAPTRSGKGVSLVVPTLLDWQESALVLDIKGENFALTAGRRAQMGQRVLRFDPAALMGSVSYNPLAEVRLESDYEIADCQNIASMIIDPDGKGLKDFWMQSAWEWLSAAILHQLYRIKKESNRTATLADVHAFMSVGHDEGDKAEDDKGQDGGPANNSDDESFNRLLADIARFDHGRTSVNAEIRRCAGRMLKRATPERSGVHSSASVQLALYSDPIVAANTSKSDFRIKDLMNGESPTSLYIVIPPSDIARLKPLVRILMNQFLTRLMADMNSDGCAQNRPYRHRLLLMLDEFTSIGKLEIFEKALAFMAGYGLKAYIIVQDLTQLQKEYGREESITSNCHIRIAFAPNKIETARLLSDLTGKTTLTQVKRSRSHTPGRASNVSDTISEVARPLMTVDECMSMPGLRKGWLGRTIAGDILIFVAGHPTIYGRQTPYFQNRKLKRFAAISPPDPIQETSATSAYEDAVNQLNQESSKPNKEQEFHE